MKLSIIIVHHNTPELLRLCLKSLTNQITTELKREIIVVDSETNRISQDIIIEEYSEVKLITKSENTGYAGGVNLGLKNAKGEYILVMNPDIIITPQSVEKMVSYLEKNIKTGLLGPQLLGFDGKIQKSYFRFYTPLTILARRTFLGKLPFFNKILKDFLMADTNPEEIQFPDWLMGSALMTSREALDRVGLMDERFFLYFEDVDWARRFWENGYRVTYLPEAKMYHYHQRKSKAGFDIFDLLIRKETRWHLMSAFKFFLKHGFRRKTYATIPQTSKI